MASNHELVRVFPLPSTSSNQDAVDTRMIKTPGSVITDDTDYMRSRFIFWFALTYNLTHHSFNSGSHGDIPTVTISKLQIEIQNAIKLETLNTNE